MLESLDRFALILSTAVSDQTVAHLFAGLMVKVRCNFAGTVQFPQITVFGDSHCLMITHMSADILVECTAKGNIDNLCASADTENRLAGLGKLLDGVDLQAIFVLVAIISAVSLLMVELWRDITATRDDQAVIGRYLEMLGGNDTDTGSGSLQSAYLIVGQDIVG